MGAIVLVIGLMMLAFFAGALWQWLAARADRQLLRQYRLRDRELQRLNRPIE